MTITVCYHLMYDLEIPDYLPNFVKETASDSVAEGELWNALVKAKCGAIRDTLLCVDDCEITGVYNSDATLTEEEILWEN